MIKRTFASDNFSGVHPHVLQALSNANSGHAPAYGADEFTSRAIAKFEEYFGNNIDVYFVYNGTAANVLALSALADSYNAIICSEQSHINVDESTAPEKFTGCRLMPVPATSGKIHPDDIANKIQRLGDQHHPQVKVISISQPTEYGTVYTIDEIKAIAAVARRYGLLLHMDGSRISNAAVNLKRRFREFTCDAGVDVLSFGGTKNGMMFGEAVVFFNADHSRNVKFIRKQSMQLHSKMRFISAQFEALLTDELWKKNAEHANAMAKLLENELRKIPDIQITQPVDANSIFVQLPAPLIPELQKESFFYIWNERISEARLMCAFDTAEEDIKNFVGKLSELMKKGISIA